MPCVTTVVSLLVSIFISWWKSSNVIAWKFCQIF